MQVTRTKVREDRNAVFQAQLEVPPPPPSRPMCTDAQSQGIRRLRIKFIRKLGRARGRVSLNIVKKRDIIADYSDPSSQVRVHALEL